MTILEPREPDVVLELERPSVREPGPPAVAIFGVDLGLDETSYIAGRIHGLIWPWQGFGDAIHMEIDRGATLRLGPDDLLIGLANVCSSGWAKEMVAYGTCLGWRFGTVHQARYNPIPSYIRLIRTNRGPDTVVLRKPELFGNWVDKMHFDAGTPFWTALGGRIVRLIWRYD